MSRLRTLTDSKLSDEFKRDTDDLRVKGKLPSIYGQMAHSEPAVRAYLALEAALTASPLTLREVEAVKLWVSERNQCKSCLSIHNVKAESAGFEAVQVQAIRAGQAIGQPRVDAVVAFTREVVDNQGRVAEGVRQNMLDAGFTDGELIDIMLAAVTITFTNYFNGMNDTTLAFPEAPPLPK